MANVLSVDAFEKLGIFSGVIFGPFIHIDSEEWFPC